MVDLIINRLNSELQRYTYSHGRDAKYVVLGKDIYTLLKAKTAGVTYSHEETIKARAFGYEIAITSTPGIIAFSGERCEVLEKEETDG